MNDMSELERRYRLLLRLLPAWYRARRADEMVDAFLTGWLDDHAAEVDGEEDPGTRWAYGWPGWAEARSIAGLAVRTRFATTAGPHRARVAGRAVRLVALLGLVSQAALGVAELAATLTAPPRFPYDRLSPGVPVPLGMAGELAIIAAFALLVHGRRKPARRVAVVALVPGLVALARTALLTGEPWLAIVVVHLPLWIAVAALCVGFHEEAPTPATRPWLLTLAGATGVALGWALVAAHIPAGSWAAALIGDPGALFTVAVLAAGIGCPVLIERRGLDRSGASAIALAVVLVAALPARVSAAQGAGQLGGPARSVLTAEFIALAAVVLVLAGFGMRGARRG